ncbi:MAG: hypothetical protein ACE5JT_00865 [Nitrosopumilaceae archaeon]
MKRRITCLDKYEAQKLGSLLFDKNGKETFITGILDVVENEIVVSLKDKSAHSVLLKNDEQVDAFTDFIQSVVEREHELKDAKVVDDVVEITKE